MITSLSTAPLELNPSGIKSALGNFDLFYRIASNFIMGSTQFAGKDYDSIVSRLCELSEGSDKTIDKASAEASNAFTDNISFLVQALAKAMQGEALLPAQKKILEQHADWLHLPANLQRYALTHMRLALLYGNPQQAIEQFPILYQNTAHPILKEKFSQWGITEKDMQQALRDNVMLDPVDIVWTFGCAAYMLEIRPNGQIKFKDNIASFATILLKNIPDIFPDQDYSQPLTKLTAIFGSKEAHDVQVREIECFVGHSMFKIVGSASLPKGLNPEFDRARARLFDKPIKEAIKFKFALILAANSGFARRVRVGAFAFPGTAQIAARFYEPAPENFMKRLDREEKKRAGLTWEHVPQALREKLTALGFESAEKLAQAINDDPGQREITQQIGIILRNSQLGSTGYVVTAYDVLKALTEPQHARYANGVAIDPLYEKMHAVVDPTGDFNAFFGVEESNPQTLEQMVAAEFYHKFREAVGNDPLLRHAVTHEQWGEFLGLTAEELKNVFERPAKAFSLGKDGMPVASKAVHALQNILKISFTEDWCVLAEERQKREDTALADTAAAARAEVVALRNAALAPKMPENDPWSEITQSVAQAVQAKFATPAALAEAITRQIAGDASLPIDLNGALAHAVKRKVSNALFNPGAGFLPDGHPCEIIHAHILKALGMTPREAATVKGFGCAESKDTPARKVQATIVSIITKNPKLAHIIGWPELKKAYPKADVQGLVATLATAYRVRSQRDPKPVLIPYDTLRGVTDALNAGLAEGSHYLPDHIVPVELWREVAKAAKGGRDPFPTADKGTTYDLG